MHTVGLYFWVIIFKIFFKSLKNSLHFKFTITLIEKKKSKGMKPMHNDVLCSAIYNNRNEINESSQEFKLNIIFNTVEYHTARQKKK